MLFLSASCDSDSEGITIKGERVIALSSEAVDSEPTIDYCEENGYKYVTYNSFADCVVALENGKVENIILSDLEFCSLKIDDTVSLEEKLQYKTEYCAVFSKGNEALYNEFNNAVKTLKADGTLSKSVKSYFSGEDINTTYDSEYKKELTVLCDSNFSEMIFCEDDGSLWGLDIYLARVIFDYLGYAPKFVNKSFDELFTALEKGNGDLIFSSVEYTDERAQAYLLTDSYYTNQYSLYKRKS